MVCPCDNSNESRGLPILIPNPAPGSCFIFGPFSDAWCLELTATCGVCTETVSVSPCPGIECEIDVDFQLLTITGTATVIVSRVIEGDCVTSASVSAPPQILDVNFTCVFCPDTDCQAFADAFNENPCPFVTLELETDLVTGAQIPVISLDCDVFTEI